MSRFHRVKLIEVTLLEGPKYATNRPETRVTFREASRVVWGWSVYVREGTYNKCSVKVIFDDDEVFTSRYDINSNLNPSVDEFCQQDILYGSGRKTPSRCSPEEWEIVLDRNPEAREKRLLFGAFYHFSDDPKYKIDLYDPQSPRRNGLPHAIVIKKESYTVSKDIYAPPATFLTVGEAEAFIQIMPEIHDFDCQVVANN